MDRQVTDLQKMKTNTSETYKFESYLSTEVI